MNLKKLRCVCHISAFFYRLIIQEIIMENVLYLGSKSQARQMLLKDAQIPFILVDQDADETQCDWDLSLQETVESIALYKMEHVVLPTAYEKTVCFALTADTLTCSQDGIIHGKPIDRADAIAKIKASAQGSRVGTAFCLDRKILHNGIWHTEERIREYVCAEYSFIVPDNWIDTYLAKSASYRSSGAIAIEGFGAQFTRDIKGSYSTIVGLPMFELREALEKIGFFS